MRRNSANQSEWALINTFGDSKTYVNQKSISRNGSRIIADVRYNLNPPGTDKRNGKPIKEMLMQEEYDIDTGQFNVHRIIFTYTNGVRSEPLLTESKWLPATEGNLITLKFLRENNQKGNVKVKIKDEGNDQFSQESKHTRSLFWKIMFKMSDYCLPLADLKRLRNGPSSWGDVLQLSVMVTVVGITTLSLFWIPLGIYLCGVVDHSLTLPFLKWLMYFYIAVFLWKIISYGIQYIKIKK